MNADHVAWAEQHARTAYAKAVADAGPRPQDDIGGALWLAEVLTRASEAIHFPGAAFGAPVPDDVRTALLGAESRFRDNGGA